MAEFQTRPVGYATVAAVAKHTSLSKSTLYALMNSGRLPFVKVPGTGKRQAAYARRVSWDDVFKFLDQHTVPVTTK
jgi:excisionase family DNA binding protein